MGMPAAWSTACPDWESRIVAKQSLIPLPPLFPDYAALGLQYFGSLKLVDVANQPTFNECARDWIREFVGHIFGSYDQHTGVRHITEYFMLISKKNSKSTLAAGIMLTALLLNWREDAEYIILAPTKEVADNSYKPISSMINADDELCCMLKVQDHYRTITHYKTNATLKVVAADSATVSGKKAVGVLIDELHEFGKVANADKMINEATGGIMSRDEGFIIYLSTQSSDVPAGVFKKKLDYARKVRDGKVHDPRFLPLLYEFPKHMIESKAYLDPKNYYITNPNLGASVNAATLKRKLDVSGEEGEDSLQDVLAKHLNVEIGLNLASDRWAGAEFWEDAGVEWLPDLQSVLKRSEVVTVGIDGGGLDDLLGLYVIGRTSDGKWLGWGRAWAHKTVLNRRKEIAPRLLDLAKSGDLVLVENIGDDTAEVGMICGEIEASGLLFQIGMDPNAIGGILDAILDNGVEQEKVVSVNQGFRLAGAIKTAERKVTEGVFKHGNQALMAWCVGNAKVKVVGNAIVVTKQVSGTAKIDPLMAFFNAVTLMALNPEAQVGSMDFSDMLIAG